MGRIAIRRVQYVGDRYEFTSPELPDGLVIVEGKNGTGKTTFADLIYFALGGRAKKFARTGSERHKEIASDSNNFVRVTIEVAAQRYAVTRHFETPEDILVTPVTTGEALVLPVNRRDNRKIFSDWLLELLGISTVTLYYGHHSGKLNLTDVLRLIYHDQDPDPSRVFKKLESDNFITDSREFRRAVFEILIGHASEEFYDAVGKLKQSEALLAQRAATLDGYKAVVARASTGREDANAHFLREAIEEKETQLVRLEKRRAQLRKTTPNASAEDMELLDLRKRLAAIEVDVSSVDAGLRDTTSEQIRLHSLEAQLIDEVVRIQKIIHAHETLALFSPDTCPCCLRKVDRAKGQCICGNAVDEAAYQRFFYSSDEYVAILKSKQKNVETVRAAIEACDVELKRFGPRREKLSGQAAELRQKMKDWAGTDGAYTTELERVDDAIVEVRVETERLKTQLDLEIERDALEEQAKRARIETEALRQRMKGLELAAQQDRTTKVNLFNEIYTQLMRETLLGVRQAYLDPDYTPVINDGEYREASAGVTRRLMYFLTLLKMSLSDTNIPFPRFLLIDTPETAGIEEQNLSKAIGKIQEVLTGSVAGAGQVILTSGADKYPADLETLCVIRLTDEERLLRPK